MHIRLHPSSVCPHHPSKPSAPIPQAVCTHHPSKYTCAWPTPRGTTSVPGPTPRRPRNASSCPPTITLHHDGGPHRAVPHKPGPTPRQPRAALIIRRSTHVRGPHRVGPHVFRGLRRAGPEMPVVNQRTSHLHRAGCSPWHLHRARPPPHNTHTHADTHRRPAEGSRLGGFCPLKPWCSPATPGAGTTRPAGDPQAKP